MSRALCLVLVVFAAALTARAFDVKDADGTKFNFEAGLGGWRAWGIREGSKEKVERIVTLATDNPHSGKQCMAVRDEFEDQAPYAMAKFKISPASKYALTGWIRSDLDRPSGPNFGATAFAYDADGSGKHKLIGQLPLPALTVGKEWQKFELAVPAFPAGTTHIFVAIRPVADTSDKKATGVVFVDDVELVETPAANVKP